MQSWPKIHIYIYGLYSWSSWFQNIQTYTSISNSNAYFASHKYLLGDKAYAVGPYLIPPFKERQARHPKSSNFNYNPTILRVQIKNAFGILRARFSSLHKLPIRIYEDRVVGHPQVIVTEILTTLVLAKVFLRLSRFNYERIEVLYTP